MMSCTQRPLGLPRMQDLESLLLRGRSFPGSGRERLSTYFDHKGGRFIQKEHRRTIGDILRCTVGCVNVTINRTTQIAKPEIGPDGTNQTRQNLPVDRDKVQFGPPSSSGSGFWRVLEPNHTDFPVHTQTAGWLPGPVAKTKYLQVLLQSRSIVTCKCITKLVQSQPQSASLSSLDLGRQVHLQIHSMTACKCISDFTQSRTTIESPNSLDHGLKEHL